MLHERWYCSWLDGCRWDVVRRDYCTEATRRALDIVDPVGFRNARTSMRVEGRCWDRDGADLKSLTGFGNWDKLLLAGIGPEAAGCILWCSWPSLPLRTLFYHRWYASVPRLNTHRISPNVVPPSVHRIGPSPDSDAGLTQGRQ